MTTATARPKGVIAPLAAAPRAGEQVQTVAANQRVADFYCRLGSPFFAAVVSTCSTRSTSLACPLHPSRPCPTRVTLVGELDVATAPLLRVCLASIGGNIEVDCSGLEFVDAQGLKVFVNACARSEHMSATFVLVAPTPMLRRLLRITGLRLAHVD